MRGRRKSIEEHKLDGTYRPNEHGVEVFKPEGYAEKPDDLGEHAAWLWDYVINDLNRVANRIDTPALTEMCNWYQVYKCNMTALLKANGDDYRVMQLAVMSWKNFEKLAARFGLTPVDRMRLKVAPAEKKRGVVSRMRA